MFKKANEKGQSSKAWQTDYKGSFQNVGYLEQNKQHNPWWVVDKRIGQVICAQPTQLIIPLEYVSKHWAAQFVCCYAILVMFKISKTMY